MKQLAVSDHAVVRYMERVLNLDIEKLRDDIRELAATGTAFKNMDGLWCPKRQVIVIIENNRVLTVLGKREAEKHHGRQLVTDGWPLEQMEAAE